MKYKWMLRPEAFQDTSEEDIVKAIGTKTITQQGIQTFEDEKIAKNWADDAVKEGFIVIRQEKHSELYKNKPR